MQTDATISIMVGPSHVLVYHAQLSIRIEQDGQSAINFEAANIQFLCDVFVAIADVFA